MSRLFILVTIGSTFAFGCASTQSQPLAEPTAEAAAGDSAADQWSLYAEALRVAFEAYEGDVQYALSLECQSEAEASAVAAAHTTARFNSYLADALERRNLSVDELVQYANNNPEFLEEQHSLYAARLARLEHVLQHEVERFRADRTMLSLTTP